MTQPSGVLTSTSQHVKNPVTDFFKGIMRDSGIKLSSNDFPNVITQEQALIVRDIDKLLDQDDSFDGTEKFLKGFKVLIKKDKYFNKALLPTLFTKSTGGDTSDTIVEIQQDSLFRILIKVNRLQNAIVEILLDDLTTIVSEENEDTARPRLLLDQLRYLPCIKNADNLTTKLLDIVDVASYPFQLDILESIPEILPDSQFDRIATELGKLLDSNDQLSSPIIDCLNSLNLDQESRAQIHDHVLAKVLSGTCVQTFPVLLDFLMTDYSARSLPTTLFKIRNAVNSMLGSADKTNKEKETMKIVVFHKLQKGAAVKMVSDAWLGLFSKFKVHTDHKPVDLLVLFMLHSHAKLKRRSVELIFRQRVKTGLLKCSLLEQLFEKYFPPQLMRDYFATTVEIGGSLFRSSADSLVTEFATTLFKLTFTNEHTERTYRQEILENLIILVGASSQKNVTTILNIFVDLLQDIAKTPHLTVILMRLLEKIDGFDLKNVEIVFEILCGLTCREESLHGLKEELHMIVRKQLSSQKRQLKHCGVVSAVVMARHVAATEEEQSELETSEESVLDVSRLKGPAREAAAILELVSTSISECPELMGLYYDQLAAMLFKSDNLDKYFQAWLAETTTTDFQNIFVTDTICEDINDLHFTLQYNLNSAEEMDTPIGINIANLTLRPGNHSIVVLASHFRLLRLLHFRQQNSDLSSIDALLGCAVVLPVTDQLSSLSGDQLAQVADCLFHCINWFRESIGAFVTQTSKNLRYKVVQRLENLLELEKLLKECLDGVPEHKLPVSYFDASTQSTHSSVSPVKEVSKPKRPRKKLKSAEIVESSVAQPSTSKKKMTTEVRVLKFREIDTDVFKLLTYPLGKEDTTPSSAQISLSIHQLNFLLKDFVSKLTQLSQNRDLGMSHFNVVAPVTLFCDSNILANINHHLLVIDKDVVHGDDATKTAFGLILECLSLVFSWSGLQHSKHQDSLRNILKALRPNVDDDITSINHLVLELIERLANYPDSCAYLTQAVSLIRTMEALHGLNHYARPKIAKTAGKLLEKRWEVCSAANIDVLVKSYLSSANIKTLCGLVGTLQEQAAELKNKTDTLAMLASIDKSNFYVLYRNFWSCLHERVKLEVEGLTNAQHLVLWRTTALTMQGLMTVAKIQETKNNQVCFLRKSIAILKIFLSHGVPILEIELKSKPDQVVEILKTIQSNTRFLHHLCCYSKLKKDSSLIAHVPQFRLALETLVYRVKAALVANGCSAAFWMGNLKNRDLQGEDILSQSTENTTTGGGEELEEENDEVMEDDSCEEMEDKSGSDVFE